MNVELLDPNTNEVVNTIAIGSIAEAEGIFGDTYLYREAVPPTPGPQEAIIRTLTKLEYMDRFTDAELAAIYTAAKTVVQMEVWLKRFELATEISLDDPRTQAGVQALEASGLIGTGRAAEILA